MQSILTVTAAAGDPLLLTEAESRSATGIASGQNDKILLVRKFVTAAIVSRCNLRAAGVATKTLRLETYSEQFRLECAVETLILARRPLVEIVSVVEDGVTLETADYEMNPSSGTLLRLCSDYPAWWAPCKITVAYRAGWATVPDNLRNAAMKLCTLLSAESGRDPNLKSIEIPGVVRKDYWVSPSDDPLISAEIHDLLGDFINPAMA
jgi:hypothetical protein